MRTVHIEKKDRNAVAEAAQTLKAALSNSVGRELGAAEASTLSGLPLDMAETALLALYTSYPATLKVGDDGKILVKFASLSKRREGGVAARLWARFKRRIWPQIVLSAQFFEDRLILLAVPLLMLALASNLGGLLAVLWLDFPGSEVLRVFPGMLIILLIGLIFVFSTFILLLIIFFSPLLLLSMSGHFALIFCVYALLWEHDLTKALVLLAYGAVTVFLGRHMGNLWFLDDISSRKSKDSFLRDIWLALNGFILGPRSEMIDARAQDLKDERQLTALLVARAGVLSARDLVTLFAWDLQEAETELSSILLDYGGDIEVTEEGHFVYLFSAWQSKVDAKTEEKSLPFWEKELEAPRYSGVTRGTQQVVSGLMALGLLGLLASARIYVEETMLFPEYKGHEVLLAGLGLWPYLLITGVMLIRWPGFIVKRRRFRAEATRRSMIKRILDETEGGWYQDTNFASKFGGELDESQGTRDGAYFFKFPALKDHGLALRGAAQVEGSGSPSS